jgi:hypothetical protein
MCDTIVHRAPDGYGGEIRDNVAISMGRLAVIDVAGGQQPIFNLDHTVRVVFSGEIPIASCAGSRRHSAKCRALKPWITSAANG